MPIFEACTVPSDTATRRRAKNLAAYELAMADTAESVAETIVRAACDKTPRLRYPSPSVLGFPVRAGPWSKR
jgi:hypothetical protein